ncbi:hypothetical protein EDC94DRAFT_590596 [Helicostylum pulchrum]|nr:hypothetical protein EDC94DRAFT_590596 [Helicostylum pulchrum]
MLFEILALLVCSFYSIISASTTTVWFRNRRKTKRNLRAIEENEEKKENNVSDFVKVQYLSERYFSSQRFSSSVKNQLFFNFFIPQFGYNFFFPYNWSWIQGFCYFLQAFNEDHVFGDGYTLVDGHLVFFRKLTRKVAKQWCGTYTALKLSFELFKTFIFSDLTFFYGTNLNSNMRVFYLRYNHNEAISLINDNWGNLDNDSIIDLTVFK